MSKSTDNPPRPGEQERSPLLVYDLRFSGGAGEDYFSNIAKFSDTVLRAVEQRAGDILHEFLLHSLNVLREPSASRAQAAVDLLTVGTVVALYGRLAQRAPGWVLSELQSLSWKSGRPAVTADLLKSALSRAFIKADHGDRRDAADWARSNPEAVLEQLPHLIAWLHCSLDLAEFSRCVGNWLSVLRTLPKYEAFRWIETVQNLFAWFEHAAGNALGGYTPGVGAFLRSRRARSRQREDRFLLNKAPVEYHLAMVSVEVANREAWSAFARCPRKLVLTPACMRGMNAHVCPGGQSYGPDVHCGGCDSACRVNKATQAVHKAGAEVYIENCPRDSMPLIAKWGEESRTGFVMVACLGIIQSLQFAARWAQMTCQFFPLEFPGCQLHYLKKRMPTTLNQEELIKIVTDAGNQRR